MNWSVAHEAFWHSVALRREIYKQRGKRALICGILRGESRHHQAACRLRAGDGGIVEDLIAADVIVVPVAIDDPSGTPRLKPGACGEQSKQA